MSSTNYPLLMTEEYWANTQLSVVRYYGHISFMGHEYIIVNKEGKDIFQLSAEADKAGREKAIEPGEPCDLPIIGSHRIIYHAGGGITLDKIKTFKFELIDWLNAHHFDYRGLIEKGLAIDMTKDKTMKAKYV